MLLLLFLSTASGEAPPPSSRKEKNSQFVSSLFLRLDLIQVNGQCCWIRFYDDDSADDKTTSAATAAMLCCGRKKVLTLPIFFSLSLFAQHCVKRSQTGQSLEEEEEENPGCWAPALIARLVSVLISAEDGRPGSLSKAKKILVTIPTSPLYCWPGLFFPFYKKKERKKSCRATMSRAGTILLSIDFRSGGFSRARPAAISVSSSSCRPRWAGQICPSRGTRVHEPAEWAAGHVQRWEHFIIIQHGGGCCAYHSAPVFFFYSGLRRRRCVVDELLIHCPAVRLSLCSSPKRPIKKVLEANWPALTVVESIFVAGWSQGASGGDGGQPAPPARPHGLATATAIPAATRRDASAHIRRFRRANDEPAAAAVGPSSFLARHRTSIHGRPERFPQGMAMDFDVARFSFIIS